MSQFVAINHITCAPEYLERFEMLFKSRAGAIDHLPGFNGMEVLKPNGEDGPYLVVSHWDSEAHFQGWMKSDAFAEGHRRAFADLKAAAERGEKPPMHSQFKTYTVLTR